MILTDMWYNRRYFSGIFLEFNFYWFKYKIFIKLTLNY
jgi:hypothetical protein